MRDGAGEAHYSSQESKLAGQRSREHSDALLIVSHLVASCRRGDCSEIHPKAVQILRSNDFVSDFLRLLSNQDQSLWESLSDQDRAVTIVEAVAWAASMSNRTKRLGRLGNAVVPQVAEFIGRQIMEAVSYSFMPLDNP